MTHAHDIRRELSPIRFQKPFWGTMSRFNLWTRKLHRWGAILVAIPLLLVIASGLLLQVKKQIPWVQPATMRGSSDSPAISFDEILAVAIATEACQVNSWKDIDRLDIQPQRSLVKVQCKNRWEIQLDLANGEILSSAYRRSDLIESLHDGTFFGDASKLAIFLPNGIVLLLLWFTGLYLWILPIWIRRRKAKKKALAGPASSLRSN